MNYIEKWNQLKQKILQKKNYDDNNKQLEKYQNEKKIC